MSQDESKLRRDAAILRLTQDPDFKTYIIDRQAELAQYALAQAVTCAKVGKGQSVTAEQNATCAAYLREYAIRLEFSQYLLEEAERIKKTPKS